MSSLNATLSLASEALSASTAALQTVSNNMANVNTPGYTREVVEFQSLPGDSSGSPSPGNGVTIAGIQSVRDEMLQRQIGQQTQEQSSANAQLSSMQQIQTIFTTSSQGIGTEMSALFGSISSLSTNPTSSSNGQAVLTAGQNLADEFNTASQTLTQQQSGLNAQVTQDVSQINQLTQQISVLNPKIAALQAQGQDGGTLQDQQDQLVLQLSQLTGVSVTNTNDGVTLTAGNGTPLVSGSQSFALQTTTGSDAMVHVLDANGNDITSTLSGGDLGGSIQTRDQAISGLLNQLDSLAYDFGNAFNAAQAHGYDQNGNPGGIFFSVPATASGAAAAISMTISNPSLIASSSDGTSGSNGNLANLSAIQTTPLASSGQTPTNAYASLVYQVGTLTANANTESNATASSLLQLNNQLNSVSGVSIDEESTQMISYQQSYEAAARVVSTVQSLYQVLMAMGTAAAE